MKKQVTAQIPASASSWSSRSRVKRSRGPTEHQAAGSPAT
jgi:hypothetical protein